MHMRAKFRVSVKWYNHVIRLRSSTASAMTGYFISTGPSSSRRPMAVLESV